MSERLSPSITADLSRCFIKLSATVHGSGWRRRILVRKIRRIVIERKKRSFVSRGNARKIVFAFSHPLMMTLYKSPLFLFFNLTKLELDWKVGKSQGSNEKVNENWRVWRVLHKSFDLKRWLLERKGGRRGEKTAVWKLDEDFSSSTLELYFILGNHRCAARLLSNPRGGVVSKKIPV